MYLPTRILAAPFGRAGPVPSAAGADLLRLNALSICGRHAEMGVSEATVRRIWHSHGLKPHLVESFKISKDKHFAEKA